MNYNYFRDYEPQTGRYVESDPIGMRGGPSMYSYTGANPLTRFDRSGLTFDDVVTTYSQVMSTFPDLHPSGGFMCADLPPDIEGHTTSYLAGDFLLPRGTIQVKRMYCTLKCLNRQQWEDLFFTLFHEAMHSTDPWWQFSEENHQKIFAREQFERSRVPRFPTPLEPVWGTPLPPPGADLNHLYDEYKTKTGGCCG